MKNLSQCLRDRATSACRNSMRSASFTVALLASACTTSSSEFPSTALATATSQFGSFEISLRTSPAAPTILQADDLLLDATNQDGKPITGKALTFLLIGPPGSYLGAQEVAAAATDYPGAFLLSNVQFKVAGTWEIAVGLSTGQGPSGDETAFLEFQVGGGAPPPDAGSSDAGNCYEEEPSIGTCMFGTENEGSCYAGYSSGMCPSDQLLGCCITPGPGAEGTCYYSPVFGGDDVWACDAPQVWVQNLVGQ